jgi:arylsulfatase A-like enzyme
MKRVIDRVGRTSGRGFVPARGEILAFAVVAVTAAVSVIPARDAACQEKSGMPNIVVILADDLGYGDLSCLNAESKIPTPGMDRLAAEGMTFTDAHSPSSVCSPTRYGVLTGRYCWRSRLKSSVLLGYDRPLIEPERVTIASLLKSHGYATAAVGKWHLGLGWQLISGQPLPERDQLPEDPGIDYSQPIDGGPRELGFDYFFGISASLDMAPYCYIENGRATMVPGEPTEGKPFPENWREGLKSDDFEHIEVLPTIADKATGWIDAQAKASPRRPLFLYFPLTAPHTPVLPNEPFLGKSKAGIYGDFVVEVDAVVGRVMDALERNGLSENTLLVLASDNGSTMTIRPFFQVFDHATNYHFRGQKSDAWDGGHRIPFLARWPAKVKAGSTCDDTVCLTDLLATAAAIVGAELPNGAGPDSYNILPDLLGTADGPIREATVHHSIDGSFAVRQGPWKLVLSRGSGGWSLPENKVPKDAPAGQLYNLDDDVGEKKNLYLERPDVVEKLTALLEKYKQQGYSRPKE